MSHEVSTSLELITSAKSKPATPARKLALLRGVRWRKVTVFLSLTLFTTLSY